MLKGKRCEPEAVETTGGREQCQTTAETAEERQEGSGRGFEPLERAKPRRCLPTRTSGNQPERKVTAQASEEPRFRADAVVARTCPASLLEGVLLREARGMARDAQMPCEAKQCWEETLGRHTADPFCDALSSTAPKGPAIAAVTEKRSVADKTSALPPKFSNLARSIPDEPEKQCATNYPEHSGATILKSCNVQQKCNARSVSNAAVAGERGNFYQRTDFCQPGDTHIHREHRDLQSQTESRAVYCLSKPSKDAGESFKKMRNIPQEFDTGALTRAYPDALHERTVSPSAVSASASPNSLSVNGVAARRCAHVLVPRTTPRGASTVGNRPSSENPKASGGREALNAERAKILDLPGIKAGTYGDTEHSSLAERHGSSLHTLGANRRNSCSRETSTYSCSETVGCQPRMESNLPRYSAIAMLVARRRLERFQGERRSADETFENLQRQLLSRYVLVNRCEDRAALPPAAKRQSLGRVGIIKGGMLQSEFALPAAGGPAILSSWADYTDVVRKACAPPPPPPPPPPLRQCPKANKRDTKYWHLLSPRSTINAAAAVPAPGTAVSISYRCTPLPPAYSSSSRCTSASASPCTYNGRRDASVSKDGNDNGKAKKASLNPLAPAFEPKGQELFSCLLSSAAVCLRVQSTSASLQGPADVFTPCSKDIVPIPRGAGKAEGHFKKAVEVKSDGFHTDVVCRALSNGGRASESMSTAAKKNVAHFHTLTQQGMSPPELPTVRQAQQQRFPVPLKQFTENVKQFQQPCRSHLQLQLPSTSHRVSALQMRPQSEKPLQRQASRRQPLHQQLQLHPPMYARTHGEEGQRMEDLGRTLLTHSELCKGRLQPVSMLVCEEPANAKSTDCCGKSMQSNVPRLCQARVNSREKHKLSSSPAAPQNPYFGERNGPAAFIRSLKHAYNSQAAASALPHPSRPSGTFPRQHRYVTENLPSIAGGVIPVAPGFSTSTTAHSAMAFSASSQINQSTRSRRMGMGGGLAEVLDPFVANRVLLQLGKSLRVTHLKVLTVVRRASAAGSLLTLTSLPAAFLKEHGAILDLRSLGLFHIRELIAGMGRSLALMHHQPQQVADRIYSLSHEWLPQQQLCPGQAFKYASVDRSGLSEGSARPVDTAEKVELFLSAGSSCTKSIGQKSAASAVVSHSNRSTVALAEAESTDTEDCSGATPPLKAPRGAASCLTVVGHIGGEKERNSQEDSFSSHAAQWDTLHDSVKVSCAANGDRKLDGDAVLDPKHEELFTFEDEGDLLLQEGDPLPSVMKELLQHLLVSLVADALHHVCPPSASTAGTSISLEKCNSSSEEPALISGPRGSDRVYPTEQNRFHRQSQRGHSCEGTIGEKNNRLNDCSKLRTSKDDTVDGPCSNSIQSFALDGGSTTVPAAGSSLNHQELDLRSSSSAVRSVCNGRGLPLQLLPTLWQLKYGIRCNLSAMLESCGYASIKVFILDALPCLQFSASGSHVALRLTATASASAAGTLSIPVEKTNNRSAAVSEQTPEKETLLDLNRNEALPLNAIHAAARGTQSKTMTPPVTATSSCAQIATVGPERRKKTSERKCSVVQFVAAAEGETFQSCQRRVSTQKTARSVPQTQGFAASEVTQGRVLLPKASSSQSGVLPPRVSSSQSSVLLRRASHSLKTTDGCQAQLPAETLYNSGTLRLPENLKAIALAPRGCEPTAASEGGLDPANDEEEDMDMQRGRCLAGTFASPTQRRSSTAFSPAPAVQQVSVRVQTHTVCSTLPALDSNLPALLLLDAAFPGGEADRNEHSSECIRTKTVTPCSYPQVDQLAQPLPTLLACTLMRGVPTKQATQLQQHLEVLDTLHTKRRPPSAAELEDVCKHTLDAETAENKAQERLQFSQQAQHERQRLVRQQTVKPAALIAASTGEIFYATPTSGKDVCLQNVDSQLGLVEQLQFERKCLSAARISRETQCSQNERGAHVASTSSSSAQTECLKSRSDANEGATARRCEGNNCEVGRKERAQLEGKTEATLAFPSSDEAAAGRAGSGAREKDASTIAQAAEVRRVLRNGPLRAKPAGTKAKISEVEAAEAEKAAAMIVEDRGTAASAETKSKAIASWGAGMLSKAKPASYIKGAKGAETLAETDTREGAAEERSSSESVGGRVVKQIVERRLTPQAKAVLALDTAGEEHKPNVERDMPTLMPKSRLHLRCMFYEVVAIGCEKRGRAWARGEDLIELEEEMRQREAAMTQLTQLQRRRKLQQQQLFQQMVKRKAQLLGEAQVGRKSSQQGQAQKSKNPSRVESWTTAETAVDASLAERDTEGNARQGKDAGDGCSRRVGVSGSSQDERAGRRCSAEDASACESCKREGASKTRKEMGRQTKARLLDEKHTPSAVTGGLAIKSAEAGAETLLDLSRSENHVMEEKNQSVKKSTEEAKTCRGASERESIAKLLENNLTQTETLPYTQLQPPVDAAAHNIAPRVCEVHENARSSSTIGKKQFKSPEAPLNAASLDVEKVEDVAVARDQRVEDSTGTSDMSTSSAEAPPSPTSFLLDEGIRLLAEEPLFRRKLKKKAKKERKKRKKMKLRALDVQEREQRRLLDLVDQLIELPKDDFPNQAALQRSLSVDIVGVPPATPTKVYDNTAAGSPSTPQGANACTSCTFAGELPSSCISAAALKDNPFVSVFVSLAPRIGPLRAAPHEEQQLSSGAPASSTCALPSQQLQQDGGRPSLNFSLLSRGEKQTAGFVTGAIRPDLLETAPKLVYARSAVLVGKFAPVSSIPSAPSSSAGTVSSSSQKPLAQQLCQRERPEQHLQDNNEYGGDAQCRLLLREQPQRRYSFFPSQRQGFKQQPLQPAELSPPHQRKQRQGLSLLSGAQLAEELRQYRNRSVGMLVSAIKGEWQRRFGTTVPALSTCMSSYKMKQLKTLLLEVPNLLVLGTGGTMRVSTIEHAMQFCRPFPPPSTCTELLSGRRVGLPLSITPSSLLPCFRAHIYTHDNRSNIPLPLMTIAEGEAVDLPARLSGVTFGFSHLDPEDRNYAGCASHGVQADQQQTLQLPCLNILQKSQRINPATQPLQADVVEGGRLSVQRERMPACYLLNAWQEGLHKCLHSDRKASSGQPQLCFTDTMQPGQLQAVAEESSTVARTDTGKYDVTSQRNPVSRHNARGGTEGGGAVHSEEDVGDASSTIERRTSCVCNTERRTVFTKEKHATRKMPAYTHRKTIEKDAADPQGLLSSYCAAAQKAAVKALVTEEVAYLASRAHASLNNKIGIVPQIAAEGGGQSTQQQEGQAVSRAEKGNETAEEEEEKNADGLSKAHLEIPLLRLRCEHLKAFGDIQRLLSESLLTKKTVLEEWLKPGEKEKKQHHRLQLQTCLAQLLYTIEAYRCSGGPMLSQAESGLLCLPNDKEERDTVKLLAGRSLFKSAKSARRVFVNRKLNILPADAANQQSYRNFCDTPEGKTETTEETRKCYSGKGAEEIERDCVSRPAAQPPKLLPCRRCDGTAEVEEEKKKWSVMRQELLKFCKNEKQQAGVERVTGLGGRLDAAAGAAAGAAPELQRPAARREEQSENLSRLTSQIITESGWLPAQGKKKPEQLQQQRLLEVECKQAVAMQKKQLHPHRGLERLQDGELQESHAGQKKRTPRAAEETLHREHEKLTCRTPLQEQGPGVPHAAGMLPTSAAFTGGLKELMRNRLTGLFATDAEVRQLQKLGVAGIPLRELLQDWRRLCYKMFYDLHCAFCAARVKDECSNNCDDGSTCNRCGVGTGGIRCKSFFHSCAECTNASLLSDSGHPCACTEPISYPHIFPSDLAAAGWFTALEKFLLIICKGEHRQRRVILAGCTPAENEVYCYALSSVPLVLAHTPAVAAAIYRSRTATIEVDKRPHVQAQCLRQPTPAQPQQQPQKELRNSRQENVKQKKRRYFIGASWSQEVVDVCCVKELQRHTGEIVEQLQEQQQDAPEPPTHSEERGSKLESNRSRRQQKQLKQGTRSPLYFKRATTNMKAENAVNVAQAEDPRDPHKHTGTLRISDSSTHYAEVVTVATAVSGLQDCGPALTERSEGNDGTQEQPERCQQHDTTKAQSALHIEAAEPLRASQSAQCEQLQQQRHELQCVETAQQSKQMLQHIIHQRLQQSLESRAVPCAGLRRSDLGNNTPAAAPETRRLARVQIPSFHTCRRVATAARHYLTENSGAATLHPPSASLPFGQKGVKLLQCPAEHQQVRQSLAGLLLQQEPAQRQLQELKTATRQRCAQRRCLQQLRQQPQQPSCSTVHQQTPAFPVPFSPQHNPQSRRPLQPGPQLRQGKDCLPQQPLQQHVVLPQQQTKRLGTRSRCWEVERDVDASLSALQSRYLQQAPAPHLVDNQYRDTFSEAYVSNISGASVFNVLPHGACNFLLQRNVSRQRSAQLSAASSDAHLHFYLNQLTRQQQKQQQQQLSSSSDNTGSISRQISTCASWRAPAATSSFVPGDPCQTSDKVVLAKGAAPAPAWWWLVDLAANPHYQHVGHPRLRNSAAAPAEPQRTQYAPQPQQLPDAGDVDPDLFRALYFTRTQPVISADDRGQVLARLLPMDTATAVAGASFAAARAVLPPSLSLPVLNMEPNAATATEPCAAIDKNTSLMQFDSFTPNHRLALQQIAVHIPLHTPPRLRNVAEILASGQSPQATRAVTASASDLHDERFCCIPENCNPSCCDDSSKPSADGQPERNTIQSFSFASAKQPLPTMEAAEHLPCRQTRLSEQQAQQCVLLQAVQLLRRARCDECPPVSTWSWTEKLLSPSSNLPETTANERNSRWLLPAFGFVSHSASHTATGICRLSLHPHDLGSQIPRQYPLFQKRTIRCPWPASLQQQQHQHLRLLKQNVKVFQKQPQPQAELEPPLRKHSARDSIQCEDERQLLAGKPLQQPLPQLQPCGRAQPQQQQQQQQQKAYTKLLLSIEESACPQHDSGKFGHRKTERRVHPRPVATSVKEGMLSFRRPKRDGRALAACRLQVKRKQLKTNEGKERFDDAEPDVQNAVHSAVTPVWRKEERAEETKSKALTRRDFGHAERKVFVVRPTESRHSTRDAGNDRLRAAALTRRTHVAGSCLAEGQTSSQRPALPCMLGGGIEKIRRLVEGRHGATRHVLFTESRDSKSKGSVVSEVASSRTTKEADGAAAALLRDVVSNTRSGYPQNSNRTTLHQQQGVQQQQAVASSQLAQHQNAKARQSAQNTKHLQTARPSQKHEQEHKPTGCLQQPRPAVKSPAPYLLSTIPLLLKEAPPHSSLHVPAKQQQRDRLQLSRQQQVLGWQSHLAPPKRTGRSSGAVACHRRGEEDPRRESGKKQLYQQLNPEPQQQQQPQDCLEKSLAKMSAPERKPRQARDMSIYAWCIVAQLNSSQRTTSKGSERGGCSPSSKLLVNTAGEKEDQTPSSRYGTANEQRHESAGHESQKRREKQQVRDGSKQSFPSQYGRQQSASAIGKEAEVLPSRTEKPHETTAAKDTAFKSRTCTLCKSRKADAGCRRKQSKCRNAKNSFCTNAGRQGSTEMKAPANKRPGAAERMQNQGLQQRVVAAISPGSGGKQKGGQAVRREFAGATVWRRRPAGV